MGVGVLTGTPKGAERAVLVSQGGRVRQSAGAQRVGHLCHLLDGTGAELARVEEGVWSGRRRQKCACFIHGAQKRVRGRHGQSLQVVCVPEVRQRKNVPVLFEQVLGFAPGSVLVVGVLLHVLSAQPLGLVDVRSLLGLGEQLPLGAQSFADLRIVHFRILLCHFPPLTPGPDHERVHGSLDMISRL